MRFDKPLIFEHHPYAARRCDRCPGGLRLFRRGDGAIEQRGVAERHLGLHPAIVRIEDIVLAGAAAGAADDMMVNLSHGRFRSEEHTSELQSLMRISYAVFCLKKKKHI